MLHIMNDISRMSNLRQRGGLHTATSSTATSEYITMIRIQKKVRKSWSRIKVEFERKYSNCKSYDHSLVHAFIETLSTILEVRLLRLDSEMIIKGDEAVEDYLLHKMSIDKNNLNLKTV